MKIYRNAQGTCINIGEWNYFYDENGVAKNLLPDDAVESDEEVIIGWDGGRYVHDDPKAVKS